MNYNGQDQWSPGRAHTLSGWSDTPNQRHTGQQVDEVEDLIDELGATSIGHQQVYDQNSAYHTHTYQLPACQSLQQHPYPHMVYNPQSFPNQQYLVSPFSNPAHLTPGYSNTALHEQHTSHGALAQTHATGHYTHRAQGSYSGDQTQQHAGPVYQNRASTFIDKGKPVYLGIRSKNRSTSDGGRDKGNGRIKAHGRTNSSRSENTQGDVERDDPFYLLETEPQTTIDGSTETRSHSNEDNGKNPEADYVTSPPSRTALNSNGRGVGNGFSADALSPNYSSATAYGYANSQQSWPQMNLSSTTVPSLPSGGIDYSLLTNRSISGQLDPRYKVHPSSKFSPGSVFKVLWSEPAGVNLNELSGEIERDSVQDPSQIFYSSIRRYIVVGNDEGNCTCVPILTYLKRGCSKAGVKPRQHGIVYNAGSQPQLLEGEPQLGFNPIQIEMADSPSETLTIESRVNYSKLMTIEHNYKVFFIGRVTPEDFREIVIPAVDACWNAKNRGTTSDHQRHISRGSIER
ncbi:hypothetical protein B0T09DRAFT_83039 [Sordaria sp. MPI-SDFR-AT-0083]|nr:hypothetical protein B0T09DRAFT_83039 [Sordaria sp. MPI-SDFR-AT-0083]